jgi:hypothetical protein
MANLNLSQFTTKTLVEDADWVFVWDTAGAISKKVSRNSLLNSGTLATSAPVTISQTWADVAQTFKALVVNAAGTSDANSASGSLLLDLQNGGVSKVSVKKDGILVIPNGSYIRTNGAQPNSGIRIGGGNFNETALAVEWVNTASISFSVGRGSSGSSWLAVNNSASIGWGNGQDLGTGVPLLDTILLRDAANTLALRNSTAAQTFNIYNTYQNAGVDYERITFKWSSLIFTIGREFGGTGGARNIRIIGGGSVIGIGEAASAAVDWTFASGTLLAGTDNSKDIGASGASRPRNVYVGSNVISRPSASITPANNSELVVEATSNTTLTFKLKGTDGTVRSATLTLA